MKTTLHMRALTLLCVIFVAVACGSSGQRAAASPTAGDTPGTVPAGGDIPDNVVWLNYAGSGFSIQYPEGWVRNATANGVTFSDKDSAIAVTVKSGPAPTKDSVTSDVRAIAGAKITAVAHDMALPAGGAIKLTYEVDGAPDPVTGKKPHLTVDRYVINGPGHTAVLDLGAQVGVDNVDAYLQIAKSFKWTP